MCSERNAAAATVKLAEAELADLRAGDREEEIDEARATVQRLAAPTVYARSTLDRTRRLVEVRASPTEALEWADASHTQTAAEVEAARQQLKALGAGPTPTAVATPRHRSPKSGRTCSWPRIASPNAASPRRSTA